ncbi:MAG: TSUP family transporter [Phormidesmis sp.]
MILLVVFGVGLTAGFVDAIAGGGGLIMLPGLLFTGLPVGSAIATNKLCGTFGALTSTLKFAQSKQIDRYACWLMALPVIVGAYLGSRSIGLLPSAWAEPTVVVLMAIITLFVVFKPSFGVAQPSGTSGIEAMKPVVSSSATVSLPRRWGSAIAGGAIGFHDGFFGPGTGVFLVFTLLSLFPIDFLRATGSTKLLNFLANVTALITFAMAGNIDYAKGSAGALGVIIGSFVGASFATKKGTKLIKPIFIVVTIALILKLLLS